eukprot:760064-Hanusia_phi.AAC.1
MNFRVRSSGFNHLSQHSHGVARSDLHCDTRRYGNPTPGPEASPESELSLHTAAARRARPARRPLTESSCHCAPGEPEPAARPEPSTVGVGLRRLSDRARPPVRRDRATAKFRGQGSGRLRGRATGPPGPGRHRVSRPAARGPPRNTNQP